MSGQSERLSKSQIESVSRCTGHDIGSSNCDKPASALAVRIGEESKRLDITSFATKSTIGG